MISIKNEIERIIGSNPNSLLEIRGVEKEKIIKKILKRFVKNNPRALWLDFKYTPESIDYEYDYPYLKIPDLFDNDKALYFLIDDFNTKFYLIMGMIKDIIFFIEQCEGLDEYYIFTTDFKKIVCETDHDELLYIDLEKTHYSR